MHFGIISTGPISHEFARAVESTPNATITAVSSRTAQHAQKFIREHNLEATAYDSVPELCASPDVDAVYIASPNSLHASHALSAINAGKHVIVEKPAAWNPVQWDQVWGAAEEAKVLVFEAARHVYEPAQSIIRERLVGEKPKSVRLNFSQLSSRWNAVQAGEEPNVFSLATGGGALVDLGVYPVYDAVLWFGEPDEVRYFPAFAPTQVDAAGTLVLMYKDFNVIISIAKNAHSNNPSEILLGERTLRLSSVQGIDMVEDYSIEDSQILYNSGAQPNSRSLAGLMSFEVAFFTDMLTAYNSGDFTEQMLTRYRSLTLLSRSVNDICTKARYAAGIFFEGETLELEGAAE